MNNMNNSCHETIKKNEFVNIWFYYFIIPYKTKQTLKRLLGNLKDKTDEINCNAWGGKIQIQRDARTCYREYVKHIT